MELEELATQLGELVALKQEVIDLRRELDKAQTLGRDDARRAGQAEKTIKALTKKSKSRLTHDQEAWLFSRNATIQYSATQTGKLKIQLKTGRFAGNGVTLLYDPKEKGKLPLREVIELAQASGR